MKIAYAERALDALESAPAPVRKAFLKQLRFLAGNLNHPSLHAKKYDQARGIWQARINRAWRFYFTIEGDRCRIQNITPHPK